jgi:hypothetical protein
MRAGAMLVAAALLVAACGRKNIPVAPELVRPDPPESLGAIVTPDGVRLTWLRPTRYSGGQRMDDLGGFVVERAIAPATTFAKIGTFVVTDQFRFQRERHMDWLDRDVHPGERYVYRVTAYTLDGYRSFPAGPIGVTVGTAGKDGR